MIDKEFTDYLKTIAELNNSIKALQIANKQLESAVEQLRQVNRPTLKVVK